MAERNVDRITLWIPPGTVDTSFESNACKLLAPWLADSYTVILYSFNFAMKPSAPSLQHTRLLDQVRERVRCLHYSRETNKNYRYWIRFSPC